MIEVGATSRTATATAKTRDSSTCWEIDARPGAPDGGHIHDFEVRETFMKIMVLGGGRQGSAAAFDLLRTEAVEAVVLADASVASPAPFLAPQVGGRLRLVEVDARDAEALVPLMEEVDGVVCALPYYFNLAMTRLALESGAHYCDLGGNTEIVEQQKELNMEAASRGLSVVPDCGLAPGMVNILAQDGIDTLGRVKAVRIRVGGLPRHPRPPLNYQIVYSMHGVLDYYTTPVLVLENGQPTMVEALSGLEAVAVPEPVGTLEAFYTAGGISTMPFRYRERIPVMDYKTLRYPGHAHLMAAIRDLGLLDTEPVEVDGADVVPRHAFIEIVSPKLRNPEGDDLVAMRVVVEGETGGRPASVRYDLVDFFDPDNGITAMMRTTGFSLALTGVMQCDGRIDPGVYTPDECVPAGEYMREMAARGVEIRRTEEVATVA
jgi:lysine 6-dehydrogenase